MRKTTLLILLIIIFHSVHAQNRLKGNIKDAHTLQALSNAIVRIPDIKVSSISDSNGNYVFNNIPAGSYLIEVSLTGHETKLETVTIKGVLQKDFVLNASVKQLQDVNVTGVIKATDKRKNPVSIISFSYQDILQNTSTNVIDAIANPLVFQRLQAGKVFQNLLFVGLAITVYLRSMMALLWLTRHGLMNLELKQMQMP